jgi:hypothetical protein
VVDRGVGHHGNIAKPDGRDIDIPAVVLRKTPNEEDIVAWRDTEAGTMFFEEKHRRGNRRKIVLTVETERGNGNVISVRVVNPTIEPKWKDIRRPSASVDSNYWGMSLSHNMAIRDCIQEVWPLPAIREMDCSNETSSTRTITLLRRINVRIEINNRPDKHWINSGHVTPTGKKTDGPAESGQSSYDSSQYYVRQGIITI